MNDLLKFLRGKKTYLVGLAAIAYLAFCQFSEHKPDEVILGIFASVMGITLRAGIGGAVKLLALALLPFCLLTGGCATKPRDLTTASLLFVHGTNRVEFTQPKDTTIGSVEFNPATGVLVVSNYTSTASAAALRSADTQAGLWQQLLRQQQDQFSLFGQLAAQRFGGGAVTSPPPATNSVPAP